MSDACETCGKPFDPDLRIDRPEYCQCPDPDYLLDDLDDDQRSYVEAVEAERDRYREALERNARQCRKVRLHHPGHHCDYSYVVEAVMQRSEVALNSQEGEK